MDDFDITRFERPVFFTGAGLSAESGIPTYRGRGGIWEQYDFREIACQEAFERDPTKVWDYHEWRRGVIGACAPNAGHHAIAAIGRLRPATRVITQNIDDLHRTAGSRDVIELHGNVWRVRCPSEGTLSEVREHPLASRHCACGAWLRPDIVWFGDALDEETLGAAGRAVSEADLFVSVGTSGVVYPAALLPAMARRAGAYCVEINPEETQLSALYHRTWRASAADVLPTWLPQTGVDAR